MTSAFDSDDYEIFDVVEEVDKNFYELLGVTQEATSGEIRKAYRRLAVETHPDKSDAEDAEVKFRQLAAVHEILRDSVKREKYNLVLINGLPNWRDPAFYYRRVRKLGIAEGLFIFMLIGSGVHYLCLWAAYYEKIFEVTEVLGSKGKKKEKKGKKAKFQAAVIEDSGPSLLEEELSLIHKPKVLDLLPFQIFYLCKYMIVSVPDLARFSKQQAQEYINERILGIEKEEEEESEEEEEVPVMKKSPRRKKLQYMPPAVTETSSATDVAYSAYNHDSSSESDSPPPINTGIWTDEDSSVLAKLVKKYPGGTVDRWDIIATAMNRKPEQVIKMASKIKTQTIKVNATQGITGGEDTSHLGMSDDVSMAEPVMIGDYLLQPKKEKKKKEKPAQDAKQSENWSKEQQVSLELALKDYRKGTESRWEKIAARVPNKNKDECMARFTHLAEMVKKKKEAEAKEAEEDTVEEDARTS